MIQSFTVRDGIRKVIAGEHLTREEARMVMMQVMAGEATHAQISALITALRMKGETIEEVTGFAEVMRQLAQPVSVDKTNLLDTCGTGGDGARTFNISTAAALVAASGGIRVAKHGNRAASSKSGSADVLEALGVNIMLDPQQAARCLEQVGICFLFAQIYHQSMKHAAAPRKEIGITTVFNLLGPLTNPARANMQLLGVFDKTKTELMVRVLKELGLKRAMVVSSFEGLDEISISAPTQVSELNNGEVQTYVVTPEQLGLETVSIDEVAGGDAQTNADIIRAILQGERGPRRDIVLANAGACFYLTGRSATLREGVELAASLIDSGAAYRKLQELIQFTGELSHVS